MKDKSLKDKKALFVVAFNDYQDMEYKKTKQVLKDAGVKVEICSSSTGTARGKFGGEIKIDILINNVNIDSYDAVVFIGGPGAVEYLNSQDAYQICQAAIQQDKILAAICMAPQILAKSGILSGKKATVFTSEADKSGVELFEKNEVNYADQDVVVDGGIITADGPDAAENFGHAIINALKQS